MVVVRDGGVAVTVLHCTALHLKIGGTWIEYFMCSSCWNSVCRLILTELYHHNCTSSNRSELLNN